MDQTTQTSGMFTQGGAGTDDATQLDSTVVDVQPTGMFSSSVESENVSTANDISVDTITEPMVAASVAPTEDIPVPTFLSSFNHTEDKVQEVQEAQQELEINTQELPVEEVMEQVVDMPALNIEEEASISPVLDNIGMSVALPEEEEVVSEVTQEIEQPKEEIISTVSDVIPDIPVEKTIEQVPVAAASSAPFTFMTADQVEQQVVEKSVPTTGNSVAGLESLKSKPEFAGIDIDKIIAHVDPTGTGTMVSEQRLSVPNKTSFRKMAAIGGGIFTLLGVGVWVLSSMFSAGGLLTGTTTQADVLQTTTSDLFDDTTTGSTSVDSSDIVPTTGDINTIQDTGTTDTSTTTQPSFGGGADVPDDEADLLGDLGTPTNALVDTVSHINTLTEKISVASSKVDEALLLGNDEAVKFAKFALGYYETTIKDLEEGVYTSNAAVLERIASIDKVLNKAIDLLKE